MDDRIDPDGIDLDWFAVDRDGHLGHFTSAGSRVVPHPVLASEASLSRILDAVTQLSPHGRARVPGCLGALFGFLKKRESSWATFAERGLFSFDFVSTDNMTCEQGFYALEYSPSEPLQIDSLPIDIRDLLGSLRLSGLCFAETSTVKREHLGLPPA